MEHAQAVILRGRLAEVAPKLKELNERQAAYMAGWLDGAVSMAKRDAREAGEEHREKS